MDLYLISLATIAIGSVLLWWGALWGMSGVAEKFHDGRLIMGIGIGMLFAACGFSLASGVIGPDSAKPAVIAQKT